MGAPSQVRRRHHRPSGPGQRLWPRLIVRFARDPDAWWEDQRSFGAATLPLLEEIDDDDDDDPGEGDGEEGAEKPKKLNAYKQADKYHQR